MTDKANYKVWIKSWSEIIRDCESRLKFVQDTLRIEVSVEEIQDRIAKLKHSVVRSDRVDVDAKKDAEGDKGKMSALPIESMDSDVMSQRLPSERGASD
jgi:hypothetical protein